MKARFVLLLLIAGVVGAGFRANPGTSEPRNLGTSEPRNLGTAEPRNLKLQTPDLLYVCIQDDAKIAVVDMATKAVLRLIDVTTLGFPATAKPHYVVVEPDGSSWYVSLIGANRVVKFDRANNVLAQFEMETPGMMAIADKNRLVVTRSMSAVNPPKRIAVLDRATMKGDELDVVFPRPHPVAAANGYAYTGSLGVNQIATVDLAQDRVEVLPIAGPTHSLVQFTVSPDRKTMLGSTDVSGQVLVFSLAQPARPAIVKTIDVGKMAFDPVFTPDGKFAWIPVKSTNEVVVVDATSWKEVARIAGEPFKQPHQIVFSADGTTAFVTNNNKMDHMADPAHTDHAMPAGDGTASLAVIDVKTRRIEKAIPLGKNLTGMGARARM